MKSRGKECAYDDNYSDHDPETTKHWACRRSRIQFRTQREFDEAIGVCVRLCSQCYSSIIPGYSVLAPPVLAIFISPPSRRPTFHLHPSSFVSLTKIIRLASLLASTDGILL